MRHTSPKRPVRLHRFSAQDVPWAKKVWRRAQKLPLVIPLCAGLTMAGLLDAVLPDADATGSAVRVARGPVGDVASPTTAPDIAADVAGVAAVAAVVPASPVAAAPATEVAPAPSPAVEAAAAPTVPATPTTTAAPTLPAPTKTVATSASSTRDAKLEAILEGMLQQGQTPYGAVVVMEAATGRVVAVAEHSTRESSEGLALRPIAPAASVFKVVTTSALLEAGVPANEKVCFHGGKTRMNPKLLQDTRRDNTCVTLGDVIPKSANVAAAKLATLHLTPDQLRDHAGRWGFGQTLGVRGLVPSTARIPDEPFSFAEAAAGFGDVKISAMHGAVLAAIVANGGHLVTPTMSLEAPARQTRVIDAPAAKALRRMMAETVASGTGRRAFHQGPKLDVSAGGKTGSLTDYKTGLDTSWFVGFAPAEAPEYVVSAVVVNTAKWHIKAPWLAKESLRHTFKVRGGSTAKGARVASR
jgi:peptidoglycan glycosyltransferase